MDRKLINEKVYVMKPFYFLSSTFVFILFIAVILFTQLPSLFNKSSFLEREQYKDWQKLSSNGNTVDEKDGPWLCVKDPKTGLVWENKSLHEGIHYGGWTYTWINNQNSALNAKEGSCAGISGCYVNNYIKKANQEKWCGLSNWRVPSVDELKKLVDPSYPEPGPLICSCLFPNTKASSYWAASADRNFRFAGINFKDGSIQPFPEHAALYLRLVSDAMSNE